MKRFNSDLQTTSGRSPVRTLKAAFYLRLIAVVAAFAGVTSCEKVIHLDLNNTTPRIVIQANIYDYPGPYYVQISKSVNFDQSNDYPPVTGAKVEISDNLGQSEVLLETTPGTYSTSALRGIPGHTYQLNVKANDSTFQATSVMPFAVEPDSIYFSVAPFSGEKVTTIQFTDPPYLKNYYHLVYFINAVRQKEFYALDDELLQGMTISYSFSPRTSNVKLSAGDKVTVWLESVDSNVYEYYRTAITEGGQSASPSNPVSNISNGALGYFNASSVRAISKTVGQ